MALSLSIVLTTYNERGKIEPPLAQLLPLQLLEPG